LAAIYDAYQRWLIDTGWADAEGQGWLAEFALEQNHDLGHDLCLVVDSFDEFNPTQGVPTTALRCATYSTL